MNWSHRLLEELRSPARKLFARNLAVLTLGELLSRALSAIAFIHLARVLSPSTYGLVELALAVLMLLTLVVDQGFATLGAREVARQHDRAQVLVGRILSVQLILAVTVYISLLVFVTAVPIDRTLILLLAGYGATLLIYPFVIGWVFQGQNRMVWVALPLALRQAIFAIVVLAIVRQPDDVLLLPVAEFAAIAVAAAVSLIAFRRSGERLSLNLRSGLDRNLLLETLPIGGSQMIWAVRMFLPTVVVGALVDPVSVGLYGAAHRVVMTIQTLLTVYFKNLLPLMSKVAAESAARLRKMLWRSLLLLLVPAILLALLTTLAAPFIIDLLYGEHYVQPDAVFVLALLIWIIPILALRRHGHYALITMGRQREELACSVVGMVFLFVLLFPLTYFRGAVGAAAAMILSELIGTCLTWWRVLVNLRNPVWTSALTRDSAFEQPLRDSRTQLAARANVQAKSDSQPIFIVGAPRSGTSLLRVLLNRHPSIRLCDETFFFYYVYDRRGAFGELQDAPARLYLITKYLETNRIRRLGLDPDKLARVLMKEGEDYPSLFLSLLRAYAGEQGKRRFGEKTPHHARHASTLRAWYPNCKLIHIVRDPRDVVASLLRMPWASKNVLANARTWLQCNEGVVRDDVAETGLLVRYEDLVSDPEKVLKRACGFLGEAYSEGLLRADKTNTSDEWWFQRSLAPVSKSRVGLWQEQLTATQVALIERVVGPLMSELGYQPSGMSASAIARSTALVEESFSKLADKVSNLPRVWYYWMQPTQLAEEEAWIDSRRERGTEPQ